MASEKVKGAKEKSDTEQSEEPILEIDEFEHLMDPLMKATVAFLSGMIGTIILAWVLGGPLGSFMKNMRGSFLYHFIPFVLSTSFFGILIYKAYIQKISGLGFLGGAVLLHGVTEFLFMISNPSGTIFNRNGNTLALIGDMLFPVAVILIYFHIELTEKLRPNLIHAIGIIGSALPIIVGGFLLIFLKPLEISYIDELISEVRDVVFVYLGVFSLIILWISLFGVRVIYGTLRHADSPEIARGSAMVLVGFASILTNFLLLGVNYSSLLLDRRLLFRGEELVIHNTWLVTFALMALILAYIQSPRFAYAVNFDVYQLIIINQIQGITLYSFTNEIRSEGHQTHDALKSPAIVAIQNLVQEIAQAEGHIVLIGMSDRIIVMKNHEEIVSVLITEKNSYFLNKGLDAFTTAFYDRYENEIKFFKGNVGVFSGAKDLINKHMPFLRQESLIQ